MQVKRAIKGDNGVFRATFEDKLLASDIVFLRTWVQVFPHRFYNPVTTLLAPRGVEASQGYTPHPSDLWVGPTLRGTPNDTGAVVLPQYRLEFPSQSQSYPHYPQDCAHILLFNPLDLYHLASDSDDLQHKSRRLKGAFCAATNRKVADDDLSIRMLPSHDRSFLRLQFPEAPYPPLPPNPPPLRPDVSIGTWTIRGLGSRGGEVNAVYG